MKSKMFKKLMAGVLAMTMTASLAACGGDGNNSTDANASNGSSDANNGSSADANGGSSEDGNGGTEDYGNDHGWVPMKDPATGAVYDLGGMDIIIRDWWTSPDADPRASGEYGDLQAEWREWCQETYHYTIKQCTDDNYGWGAVPETFTKYVQEGGDSTNYVFLLRWDPSMVTQINSGLMYPLDTLPCLDFTSEFLTSSSVYKDFQKDGHIYAMYAGGSEPRGGVYFNKRLLKDYCGMEADELYDLQKNKQWTWDKMIELMDKVQKATDGLGDNKVYGCNANNTGIPYTLLFSNDGAVVRKTADGKFEYALDDAKSVKALEKTAEIYKNYWEQGDKTWDQYKDSFKAGKYLFMFEECWAGQANGFLSDMQDDWGFVMVPMGPDAKDYSFKASDNPVVIPGCYDADRANKCALAWMLYNMDVPGWTGDTWQSGYQTFDKRAINESLAFMRSHGVATPEVLCNIDANGKVFGPIVPLNDSRDDNGNSTAQAPKDVSTVLGEVRDEFKTKVAEANAK